jgi:glutathione S-transferase
MALRNECGMNLHRPVGAIALSADAQANVARIQQIWLEAASAMASWGRSCLGPSAPPTRCSRRWCTAFCTYAIEVAPQLRDYMDAMLSQPAFQGGPAPACRNHPDRPVRDGLGLEMARLG